eukprot:7373440-Ditylum_brightwellii.AAC.1
MSQVTEDTNGNKNQKDGDVKKNEKKGANNRKANEEESGSDEEDEDGSNGDASHDKVDEEDTLVKQLEENEKSKVVTMSPQVRTRKQRLLALGQSGAIDPDNVEHQE